MPMLKRYYYWNYRRYAAVTQGLARRFTAAGWIALFGMLFCAARSAASLSVGYQAFVFLFILLVVARVGSFWTKGRFAAERRLPRLGSAGSPLVYRIVLRNLTGRAWRSLSVLEDTADPYPSLDEFLSTPEPGEARRNWFDRQGGYYRWCWLLAQKQIGRSKEQSVPLLPARGRVEVQVQLWPQRRGIWRLSGLTLASPDPFGLYRSLVHLALPGSVLILPKRYPLPPQALPGTRKYQAGGVALASSVGESEEFVALRDYRNGDPLRHIHWKSWAKTGKPIVKEFQDEFFVRHALILDTFGEPDQADVFEEAVSVAASFACTLHTQDGLLDLLFVGPQAFCFTSGRGLAHTDQMLEILAAVRMCRHQPFSVLGRLVLEHSQLLSGCVAVLLSWDRQRQELIEHLHRLGVPLRVLVITEPGQGPALDAGPLRAAPESFRALERGKIAEGLASL